MKTALQLLQAYQDNIQAPTSAAALFAEDGVLEIPTVHVHAQGPAAIEQLVADLLVKIPDFRFKDFKVWIDTPDKVFGEYSVEALVVGTGKVYRQTYAGLLIAEGGKIKLLREALDTAAGARAFSMD
ncbi:SnoaL-like domain-containing protein [Pseudomonas corrugata]|uniref:SnoaL-like domain-containing protein n=1 Tax=Pseudomonas corrugata TaxID=47879 RepID=A0A7Y6DF43_9PSED|nr:MULTISPECIES: nuclear transport factor 2 family protein [Pseudomonas]MCI0997265.1 nuclear transport factor 2 family protein [Pseudomonas corrugata]MDU9035650.1 nuclear transport factor 2 family protein [Pseudomonas corrugata]NUT67426.1 SnoaL-like domain-containing protein [Pseudomonas corrugata]NUT85107.1 SnoaL-like domain-containing protein [Pseudomonas corrugata]QTH16446.1 nuclear transport factor 2 family protein [Pseudomonas corrugata]